MKEISGRILLFFVILNVFMVGSASAVSEYLDYGLYWHGKNNVMEKFVAGKSNAYYSPSKPTVIFIHGWQKNTSVNGYSKANLRLTHDSVDVYTQNFWIDKGWNVGIYHWEQFADEDDVQWAEAKIWTTKGPKGMRYRLSDGSFSTALLPATTLPVAEMAYRDIVAALANYTGGNIRLAGHSLGNQMVTRVAELIHNNIVAGNISEIKYRIQRIALLDPAWTKDGKTWLGDSNGDGKNDWVGERCRWALYKMIDRWTDSHNFVVEIYNTTPLDQQLGIAMDANLELRSWVCTTSVKPWYYSATELIAKHSVASRHYFWSMAFNPPVECTVNIIGTRISTGKMAPSASTPEWRIKEMMGVSYKWDQVEGRYTETPADDWFQRINF